MFGNIICRTFYLGMEYFRILMRSQLPPPPPGGRRSAEPLIGGCRGPLRGRDFRLGGSTGIPAPLFFALRLLVLCISLIFWWFIDLPPGGRGAQGLGDWAASDWGTAGGADLPTSRAHTTP